ncbi:MAG TPA: hypothetical protein VIQ60_04770 [Gemmatimonadaceae bacterium]|jgi:hypothetical protein
MTGLARMMQGGCMMAITVLALTACKGEEKGPNGELRLHGTVHMVQSEEGGTCWKLSSSKGNDYELQPAQVPQALLGEGVQAVVMAKPRSGGSFCKVGQIVDVTQVDSVTTPEATPTTT